jgi:dipeptidyl-peptidase-3
VKTADVNKKEKCCFEYFVEQFSDIKVLRYQILDGKSNSKRTKTGLCIMAGTSGRDIMWDQNYRYDLKIRRH